MAVLDEWDGPWDAAPPWFPPALPSGDEPDVVLLESLERVLGTLKARSSHVLRRRLGQSPEGRETLQEIGDSYELTGERIRQIEKASIRTIRTAARRRVPRNEERPTDEITARLTLAFRSLSRIERGRYLRATFPEASVGVLARVLEPCGPASKDDIAGWIKAYERSRKAEDRRALEVYKEEARWSKFASGTVWPERLSAGGWFPRTPCRAVRTDGGRQWSAKLNRRVEFESGLEERLVHLFERAPAVLEYCEQPFMIDYPWFSGPRRYVPDSAVRLADGRSMLVEAKPRVAWADGVNLAKWNAAVRWCEARGWGFLVSDERGEPGLLVGGANADDGAALERLTAHGPATWPELRRHWFDDGRSWTTLVAASLTYGFALMHTPFEVRRARKSPWIVALAQTHGAGGPT